MTLKTKGKGNVKAQRKRRRQRLRTANTKRATKPYQCIDNNFTWYPTAYCERYKGALTEGLINVHRCREKGCMKLREGDVFD